MPWIYFRRCAGSKLSTAKFKRTHELYRTKKELESTKNFYEEKLDSLRNQSRLEVNYISDALSKINKDNDDLYKILEEQEKELRMLRRDNARLSKENEKYRMEWRKTPAKVQQAVEKEKKKQKKYSNDEGGNRLLDSQGTGKRSQRPKVVEDSRVSRK